MSEFNRIEHTKLTTVRPYILTALYCIDCPKIDTANSTEHDTMLTSLSQFW